MSELADTIPMPSEVQTSNSIENAKKSTFTVELSLEELGNKQAKQIHDVSDITLTKPCTLDETNFISTDLCIIIINGTANNKLAENTWLQ